MEGKDVVLVKNLEEEFEIDLYGTITEESTQPILQQLKAIKEIAKETVLNNMKLNPNYQEPLPVVKFNIFSNGGSMYHTFAITNEMLKMKEMGVYFKAEVNSMAASGGFFILMCCDERSVTNDDFCTLLYHTVQLSLPFGNGTQHIADIKRYNKMLDNYKDIIVKTSKVTKEKLDEYDDKDWIIDVEEARELEIINDHIEEEIEPVEIKMSDMIKQLESSGYTVVNDLKETKEKPKKTKKENK